MQCAVSYLTLCTLGTGTKWTAYRCSQPKAVLKGTLTGKNCFHQVRRVDCNFSCVTSAWQCRATSLQGPGIQRDIYLNWQLVMRHSGSIMTSGCQFSYPDANLWRVECRIVHAQAQPRTPPQPPRRHACWPAYWLSAALHAPSRIPAPGHPAGSASTVHIVRSCSVGGSRLHLHPSTRPSRKDKRTACVLELTVCSLGLRMARRLGECSPGLANEEPSKMRGSASPYPCSGKASK
jgi:hypothetical protein